MNKKLVTMSPVKYAVNNLNNNSRQNNGQAYYLCKQFVMLSRLLTSLSF